VVSSNALIEGNKEPIVPLNAEIKGWWQEEASNATKGATLLCWPFGTIVSTIMCKQ
jgi:hypothetical protein